MLDADYDGNDDAEIDDAIATDVFTQALTRAELLGDCYPFDVTETSIRYIASNRRQYELYLFSLFLSALEESELDNNIRHWFEVESCELLHDYFGGESFHFGWTALNKTRGKIQKRIEEFCEESSLHWTPRKPVRVSNDKNDIGIDAIIWKQCDDRRENAFVALGQCAAGKNWDHKLETASPRHLNDCLEDSHAGPMVLCFLTPFQIPARRWRDSAQAVGGLLFDRLRIIIESHQNEHQRCRAYTNELRAWVSEKLNLLLNG